VSIRQDDVVPLSFDPSITPSHIADHSDIETCKQRVRSFQPTCRIVVTRGDDRFHGRPCPMQSFNGFVEQSLCLAGWVLAIENISRHEQRVDFSLGNDSDQLVEYARSEARFGLGNAIVVFSGCGFAVMIVALCMLPETKGRPLASLEAAQ